MEAFDFVCYAIAIVGVLWLRGSDSRPSDIPDIDLPSLPELLAEAAEATAKPVALTEGVPATPARTQRATTSSRQSRRAIGGSGKSRSATAKVKEGQRS
ncbi:MAG: hypothetical protein ACHWZW_02875 [Spirulina sp.]